MDPRRQRVAVLRNRAGCEAGEGVSLGVLKLTARHLDYILMSCEPHLCMG